MDWRPVHDALSLTAEDGHQISNGLEGLAWYNEYEGTEIYQTYITLDLMITLELLSFIYFYLEK